MTNVHNAMEMLMLLFFYLNFPNRLREFSKENSQILQMPPFLPSSFTTIVKSPFSNLNNLDTAKSTTASLLNESCSLTILDYNSQFHGVGI